MKDKKYVTFMVLFIITAVILGIVLFFNLIGFLIVDNEVLWFKEESDDGKYVVSCYTVGESMLFEPQKISVRFYGNRMKNDELDKVNGVTFETELANDGASLHEDNYKVEWQEDSVKIIFNGEETDGDNIFIIPYSK